MKTKLVFVALFFIWTTYEIQVKGAVFSDTSALYQYLFANYTSDLRPQADLSQPIKIGFKLYLFSINNFDEISGILSAVVGISMQWKDFRLEWTPSSYSGLNTLTVPRDKIWTPDVYLIDPANEMKAIGDGNVIGRLLFDGSVIWSPGGLVQSLCNVNMYSFPFDTQVCTITFTLWGYLSAEAILEPLDNITSVDTLFYSENAQWEMKKAILIPLDNGARSSLLQVQLTLHRRALYFVINMLAPILLLSVLNPLVFILPVDSGERVSFAVTIFLSFAVFLTLINDNMPKSSEPMAAISYFLIVIMCMSTLIIVFTILNLYLHFKEEEKEVNKKLVLLLRYLKLSWLFKRERMKDTRITVSSIENTKSSDNRTDYSNLEQIEREKTDLGKMNWKSLANEYDRILMYYYYVLIFLVWIILILLLSV